MRRPRAPTAAGRYERQYPPVSRTKHEQVLGHARVRSSPSGRRLVLSESRALRAKESARQGFDQRARIAAGLDLARRSLNY